MLTELLTKYDQLNNAGVLTDELVDALCDVERALLTVYFTRKGLPQSVATKLSLLEWEDSEVSGFIDDLRSLRGLQVTVK
ncbi:hypothetical protein KIS4809_4655 [Bacillus sp. ZZV12-4809]|nr:hypothetical protein KIS4809_4655 [Bacillus sp. ZZV12-4809]